VVKIEILPLRDRMEDVPILEHSSTLTRSMREVAGFSDDALACLMAHRYWQHQGVGNLIERALWCHSGSPAAHLLVTHVPCHQIQRNKYMNSLDQAEASTL
jgi:transcriptional regulator with PAS, ATPase and Fis domain